MINLNSVLDILPKSIRYEYEKLDSKDKLQEIRIRADKPLIFYLGSKEVLTNYRVKSEDLKSIMQRMSGYSIYAFEQEIRQGYITIEGGHRIGICGSCVTENNSIKTIKDIASINIRICREIIGCSNKVLKYICKDKEIQNTIIISPPKCGKTTILRDIVRNLSLGIRELNISGKKVSVIDERSEIAACYKGMPQLEVGLRTDIFDNCPKHLGIIMAIRSMAPEVIVADEIGTSEDIASIIMALNCGVKVITTIHGNSIEDFINRKVFNDAIENKVFKRAIVLSNKRGIGTIEYIYDFDLKRRLEVNI
ncbi:stage III sporulation protein AA [Clostridium collagenovorans DSM 3089]|uniref:Stage III sporulation protein AA n=1 Tax=Clostridium collagenovorans DSM 3089 TaxID=1121306 RepID=A0A1M5T3B7_9CLOT|nr:stage III sporulation protein AA [Clostridium collagenovorans DSM 3089]